MTEPGIHAGHRERLRERYMKGGLESFRDHEVLELLLFYCIKRADTNELAHKLLNDFGSLEVLFESDPKDIQRIGGVSEQTAVFLSMIPALAGRYYGGKNVKGVPLDSSDKIGRFSVSLFAGKTEECFYCICLDNRRRLIAAPLISSGTVAEARIYPRRAAAEALKYKAVAVALAHNHPSGDTEPSESDLDATESVKAALEPLEIEVLDHIITGGDKYYSFAENNIKI